MAESIKSFDYAPTDRSAQSLTEGFTVLPNGTVLPVKLPSDYPLPKELANGMHYFDVLMMKYGPQRVDASKYNFDEGAFNTAFSKYISNELGRTLYHYSLYGGGRYDPKDSPYGKTQAKINEYEQLKNKTDETSKQRASQLKSEIDSYIESTFQLSPAGEWGHSPRVILSPQQYDVAVLQAARDTAPSRYAQDLAKTAGVESSVTKYFNNRSNTNQDLENDSKNFVPQAQQQLESAVQSFIASNPGATPDFARMKAYEQLTNSLASSGSYGGTIVKGTAFGGGLSYDQYLGNYIKSDPNKSGAELNKAALDAWEADLSKSLSINLAGAAFNDVVYNKVPNFTTPITNELEGYYQKVTSAANQAIQYEAYLDRHLQNRWKETERRKNEISAASKELDNKFSQDTYTYRNDSKKIAEIIQKYDKDLAALKAESAAIDDAWKAESRYIYSPDFILEGEDFNKARQVFNNEVRDRVTAARRKELDRDALRLDRRNELLEKQKNNTLTAEEGRILRGEVKDPVTDSYYPFRTSEDFIELAKQAKTPSEYQQIMDRMAAEGMENVVLAPFGPTQAAESTLTSAQKAARQDALYNKLSAGTITPEEVQVLLGNRRDPVTNATLTPSQNLQRELESYLQTISPETFEREILGINLPEGQFSSRNLAEQRVRELFAEQGYTLNTPENREALDRWTTLFKDLGENAALSQWNQGVTQQRQSQPVQQPQQGQVISGISTPPTSSQEVVNRSTADQIWRAMLKSGGYDFDKTDPITSNYFTNYIQRFGADAAIAEYEKLGGAPIGASYRFTESQFAPLNLLTFDSALDVAKRLYSIAGFPTTGYSINQQTGERIDNEENLYSWARSLQGNGLNKTIEEWNQLVPNKRVGVTGIPGLPTTEVTETDPETGAPITRVQPFGGGENILDLSDIFKLEETRRLSEQEKRAGDFKTELDYLLSGRATPGAFTPSDIYNTPGAPQGTFTPTDVYGTAGTGTTGTGTTTSTPFYPSPYLTTSYPTAGAGATTGTTGTTTLPPPSSTPQAYTGAPLITRAERPSLDPAIQYLESTRPGEGPMQYMTPEQAGATSVQPASYADLFGYTPYTEYIGQSEYTTPMTPNLYAAGYGANIPPEATMRQGGSVADARGLASLGRGGDTMLVHMNPEEVAGLRALAMQQGEDLTINPDTGLPEANRLKRIFKKVILPAAAAYFGAPYLGGIGNASMLVGLGAAAKTGSFEKGLQTGLAAYGGASLASSAFGASSGVFGSPASAATTTTSGLEAAAASGPNVGNVGTVGAEYGGVDGMFAAPPAQQAALQQAASQMPPPPPTVMPTETGAQLPQQTSSAYGGVDGMFAAPPTEFGMMGEPLQGQTSLTSNPEGAAFPPPKAPPATVQTQAGAQQPVGKFQEMTGMSPSTALLAGTLLTGTSKVQEEAKKERDLYKEEQRKQDEEEERRRRLGQQAYEYAQRPIDTRMMYGAGGGLVALARGGMTYMEAGGTTGPTGQPRMVAGNGDGMSDSVPATIEGVQEARLANDEFVIPADVVADIGNGSSSAGARKLYDMMDRIREARHGTTEQPPEISAEQYMPA